MKEFVILLLSFLLLVGCDSDKGIQAGKQVVKLKDTKACKKAFAPLILPQGMWAEEETVKELKQYKKLWVSFCKGEIKHKKGGLSVEPLLQKAWVLIADLRVVHEKDRDSGDPLYANKRIIYLAEHIEEPSEKINELLTMLPAAGFEWSGYILWYRYADFYEVRGFLYADESLFIRMEYSVYDKDRWKKDWGEFVGCSKFGEANWVADITLLDRLQEAHEKEIQKRVKWQNNRLKYALIQDNYCTCKEKAAVALDIEQVIKSHQNNPKRQKLIQRLKEQLKKIKAGEIEIKSDALNECSYG